MRRTAVLALTLFPAIASAAANCLPIVGTVRLTPNAACNIAGMMPGVPFDTNQCFTVQLKLAGFIPANGYAGVTHEALLDTLGNHAVTPAFIPSDAPLNPPRQTVQTARSTFSLGRTQFYAAEVIVAQPVLVGTELVPRWVTEQSVITGTNGQGLFANFTTGALTILGNSINQDAQVRGEVCKP